MRPPQTTVRNFFHSGRGGLETQGTPREIFGSIPTQYDATTEPFPAKAGTQLSACARCELGPSFRWGWMGRVRVDLPDLVGGRVGSPEFSNQVQHLRKVLGWDEDIDSSVLRRGSRLPVYRAKAARSGRSLQLWIARHRRSLES